MVLGYGYLQVTNSDPTDVTVFFDYALSANLSVDDPLTESGFAEASVLLSVLDPFGYRTTLLDQAISVSADGQLEVDPQDPFEYSFRINTGGNIYTFEFEVTSRGQAIAGIPEPGAMAVWSVLGIVCLGFGWWRKCKAV
jgi:hypothetical protein